MLESWFWRILWFVIAGRARIVAKKLGKRGYSGWEYTVDDLYIECYANAIKVRIRGWKTVLWMEFGKLKLWKFGPWVEKINQLRKGIKP